MNNYAVINLKTDPKLKKQASDVAKKLGISISAVLNNELRRFAAEKLLTASKKLLDSGDYHRFKSNEDSLKFLSNELK